MTLELAINTYNIIDMEDDSDTYIKRVLYTFANGYKLSIIRGMGTYGNREGLFEIAIFDPAGNWAPALFENGDGDNVLGWQSVDDVMHYVRKLGAL